METEKQNIKNELKNKLRKELREEILASNKLATGSDVVRINPSTLFAVAGLKKINPIVAGFRSIKDEPHLVFVDSIDWVFPKVTGKEIRFYKANTKNEQDWTIGSFGIVEPKDSCERVENSHIEMVLAPGMAFDIYGGRLGRGGGFYDRFFSEYEGIKVGVCQHKNLVRKNLKIDAWDKEVDFVLTEQSLYQPFLSETGRLKLHENKQEKVS